MSRTRRLAVVLLFNLGLVTALVITGLVNAGWLLVLNIAIAAAAIQHLATGARRVEGLPVLIVSAVAAAVRKITAVLRSP